jgi:hypothetical protein
MDVLTGREKAASDLSTFILPGSRRLITEHGIFGDNRDVMTPAQNRFGGGVGSAGSIRGGGRLRGMSGDFERNVVGVELELDIAILEDGLCVGPDAFGLRESLIEQMQTQSDIAGEIVRALRDGATSGRIFEILRPLARRGWGLPSVSPGTLNARPAPGRHEGLRFTPLLSMFARSAIDRLISAEDSTLLSWFEDAAAITPLHLHRPQ